MHTTTYNVEYNMHTSHTCKQLVTSLGFFFMLNRGWPHFGQYSLRFVGKKTNLLQLTQPCNCITTALPRSCRSSSPLLDVVAVFFKNGFTASNTACNVLLVHPHWRWAYLSACHTVFSWPLWTSASRLRFEESLPAIEKIFKIFTPGVSEHTVKLAATAVTEVGASLVGR